MNVPSDWPLLVLAVGTTLIAIDAGSDLVIAVPAGIAAVALAGLLLVASLGEVGWRGSAPARLEPPTTTSSLRAAFRAGRAGRMSIVTEVDRLDRRSLHPELRVRSPAEEDRLRSMPRSEFLQYLHARLDEIERSGP